MPTQGNIMQGRIEDGKCVFFLEGRVVQENVRSLERELQDLLKTHPDRDFILDAQSLDYISGKGLRALLKLVNESAGQCRVRNVSDAVYALLETAGVTELINVETPIGHVSAEGAVRGSGECGNAVLPRRVSTDGSQVLGAGRSSTVYQVDSETLVKKYDEHVPVEAIRKEMRQARTAFVSGIPTAMPRELVRADDSYGIIFELIAPAVTVGSAITEHAERFDEIAKKFTELLKQIHRTRIGEGNGFPAERDIWLCWVEGMRPHYSEAEIGFLREMVSGIPERGTMVHCDFHENNVLVSGNDLILIDMADIGYGHPIFDLAGGAFRAHASLIPGRRAHHGLSAEDMLLFWKAVLRYYFDTDDPEKLDKIQDMCRAFGLVRSALFPMKHVHIGDELRQIHIDDAKRNLFPRQGWALRQLGNLGQFF